MKTLLSKAHSLELARSSIAQTAIKPYTPSGCREVLQTEKTLAEML
jgi:hypothetical protein